MLVSEEFPPFMFGGIGAVAFDLASSLSKRKLSTVVFCGRSKKMTTEKPNDYLEIIRLPCLDLPPRFLWFQVQNFLRILGRRGCGIIHAVSPQVAFLCAHLKKALRRPLITSYHGVPFYELRGFVNSPIRYWTLGDFGYNLLEFPLNDTLIRCSLQNSEKIVACSRAMLSELRTFYGSIDPQKSLIINNGVDFEKIEKSKDSSKESENTDDLSILFAGRLYYLKGITFLIRALQYLLPEYPSLKLNIFGTGPLKDKIQALVLNRGLKNNVFLHGQVDRSQLIRETSEASVIVCPSLREAQPVSVLEAMALKKPVVAFDVPFAREIIIDQHSGFLARVGDSRDLAAKIGISLSDRKLRDRIGQNAYEHVKQDHDWDKLVNKYIDLYEDTASSR